MLNFSTCTLTPPTRFPLAIRLRSTALCCLQLTCRGPGGNGNLVKDVNPCMDMKLRRTDNASDRHARQKISPGEAYRKSRLQCRGKGALLAQDSSTIASSTSRMGISSRMGYTRWHCAHFRASLSAFRVSGCLHNGQTKSSKLKFVMRGILAQL